MSRFGSDRILPFCIPCESFYIPCESCQKFLHLKIVNFYLHSCSIREFDWSKFYIHFLMKQKNDDGTTFAENGFSLTKACLLFSTLLQQFTS